MVAQLYGMSGGQQLPLPHTEYPAFAQVRPDCESLPHVKVACRSATPASRVGAIVNSPPAGTALSEISLPAMVPL